MDAASSALNRLYAPRVNRNVSEASAIVTESTCMRFTSESSTVHMIGNGTVPSSAARHVGVVTL